MKQLSFPAVCANNNLCIYCLLELIKFLKKKENTTSYAQGKKYRGICPEGTGYLSFYF